jgi:hypothetical protein
MTMRRILSAVLWFLLMNAAPSAYGVDLLSQFHPYISLQEKYSDNLYLRSTNKKDDFITTVQPGIRFSNMEKTSGIDLDYRLGLVFYEDNTQSNYISHTGTLNAKYAAAEHIYFYLKESFIRSDEPREREYSGTAAENQYVLSTDKSRAVYWRNVLAPTVEYRFGPENRLGLNYRNNIYQSQSAISQDSQENYINPFFSYWIDRQNGIALDYGLTYGHFQSNPDMVGHRANARYTNRFSEKSSAFADYTYSNRTFESPGVDYEINQPNVGITYAFTPTLTASAQAGYYWMSSKAGAKQNGFSYKGELQNSDQRTTYRLGLQGGYTEDFFTAENLGFQKYNRLTGSLTHQLDKRVSIGCLGSVEQVNYDSDRDDTIWEISGTASYTPLKWLRLSLEVAHREDQSDLASADYSENSVMLQITATY